MKTNNLKREIDEILDDIEKVLEKFTYILENSIEISIENEESPKAEIESGFINDLRGIKEIVKEDKEFPESLQYPSRDDYIIKELDKYRLLK
jgi:hypothetical protein